MFEIMMSEFETSFACWQWQRVWRRVNPMLRPAPRSLSMTKTHININMHSMTLSLT